MKPSLEPILFEAKDTAHPCQRFHSHLIGALEVLQFMQDRAEVGNPLTSQLTRNGRYPLPADGEIAELMNALGNGGLWITSGSFDVMVFKRSAKESSCKRP